MKNYYCCYCVFQQPLRAMGHDWHPECFNCDKCRVPLSPDNFLEKNGRPYCPNCFDKLFMPKCYGCSKPIKGTVSFFFLFISNENNVVVLFSTAITSYGS